MLSFIVILCTLGIIIADPISHSREQKKPRFGITEGDAAVIENHPFQINIEVDSKGACSGSIISEQYIITSGGCADIVKRFPNNTVVRSGSSHTGRDGTEHYIDQIITNEDLGGAAISLMRVQTPFRFDRTHKAIPLYGQDEEITTGSVGVVTGWGTTKDDIHDKNDQLYQINMTVLDDKVCRKEYGLIYDNRIMICAMNDEHRGKDICWGDAADPLVIDKRLAGFAIGKKKLCTGTTPVIYTKVAHYHDWIKENIQQ
ncbi:hypothetical protein QAD02_023407 [Eretmocerus hayati]|uniref:Uncharacterized protein n=1 Tax=Eretmocerus hayati TaxID=131215 RepID=A0ACC2PXD6_9HYME|nr:hypothetical protein QAD02_023407 [Eretmocerus hayati]